MRVWSLVFPHFCANRKRRRYERIVKYYRSSQDLGLKKEFKRSSEFTSRSSRPESFSDVSRGREVIVRRDTLSTTATSIDPRQVKER